MMSENKYSDEDIVLKLSKFGTVYLYKQITEDKTNIKGNANQKERINDFFKALVKFEQFAEKLKSTTLFPNLTLLLYGPPGTGKTSLIRAYAREYKINVCVVESDRLVSSLLGETVDNIRNAVETAMDIAKKNGPFILFFDEIDAIGSERSNVHEVGEIKRAVISFLQTIDRISYEGVPLGIIGATNHQQQLDSAIWRRFTFHLEFDFPDFELREEIIKSFIERITLAGLMIEYNTIENELQKELIKINSIAEDLQETQQISSEDMIIKKVRELDENKLITLTYGYSGSDIERGIRVALIKSIGENKPMTYKMLYDSLKLVGGTATHVERQELLSSPTTIDLSHEGNKLLGTFRENFNEEEFQEYLSNIIRIFENIHNIFEKNTNLIEKSRKSKNPEAKFYSIIEKLYKLKNG